MWTYMEWAACDHSGNGIINVYYYLYYNICTYITMISLKALCHSLRADRLLMNPHAPTRKMKTGRGGWLISSRLIIIQVCPLRLSLEHVRHFKHRMCSIALTYQYSYPLASRSWRSWASPRDHEQNLCAARARVRPPHTPVHYTAILGVPILPVPTLIEFLN